MHTHGKLIGLIGGVGPWAGLDVHRKILESCNYRQEQECVSVMHLSFPGKYTDRTDYILGKTAINPAYAFIEELQALEVSGVKAAAIVCNTAHADPIFSVMEQYLEGSSLNYVHIIRETCRQLERDGIRKAGLLATTGTYNLNLYRNEFNGTICYPDADLQQAVHAVIYDPVYGLKTHFPKTCSLQHIALRKAAAALIAQGAEALILGCTELPLLADTFSDIGIPVYDPNKILAEQLIAACALPGTVESDPEIHMHSFINTQYT